MNYKIVGLGDVVAAWLSFFGINKWPGCGCDKRQRFLNQLKVAILTQEAPSGSDADSNLGDDTSGAVPGA